MKPLKYLLLFVALIVTLNVNIFAQKYTLKDVQIMWNKYVEYPSSNNALLLSKVISDSFNKKIGLKERDMLLKNIFIDIKMLEKQIYSSDKEAVKLGFELHQLTDGSYTETMDIILGSLIRINAKLFLETLCSYRNKIARLDALVGNLGPQYIDRYEAQKLEAKLRIEALSKICDPKLNKLRDECIKSLETYQ
jgi:hypothetical protein